MNKKILIAAVIGIIAGGVGGFFVANRYQLSVGANQSQAGLFIRRCIGEWDDVKLVSYLYDRGYVDRTGLEHAIEAYDSCVGP